MTYSSKFVQVTNPPNNFSTAAMLAHTSLGFNGPFNYLLFSMWVCLGSQPASLTVNDGVPFFLVTVEQHAVQVILKNGLTFMLNKSYAANVSNVRTNILLSVDTQNKIAQLYINDQLVNIPSSDWTASGSFNPQVYFNQWDVGGAGSSGGNTPSIADVYVNAPASFFDLSDPLNRRKFINADLSPVDLGTYATSVTGSQPPVWLNANSGTANDLATNYGFGGPFSLFGVNPLVYQPDGVCIAPTIPCPDFKLVEIDGPPIGGFAASNTAMGFPAATPFDTLVFSMWTCLPAQGIFHCNGGPAYIFFFQLNAGPTSAELQLGNMATGTYFFDGVFDYPGPNILTNHLISVNCATQTVQYYANDQPLTLASGGWTSTGQFDITSTGNAWSFAIGSSGGFFPAFTDLFLTKTVSFVDFTVTANRRKFIAADGTPVCLGLNGSFPFGSAPQIFQTIPVGGVPNDFLVNRGLGSSFTLGSGHSLSFQAPGTCGGSASNVTITGVEADFQIGNLTAFILSTLELTDIQVDYTTPPALIDDVWVTLRWSDDAGASWSNGILRSLGELGEYFTTPTWWRLGMSRSRVYELSWSGARAEALSGAFVEYTISET